MNFIPLLIEGLLAEGPQLFSDIATGEGGLTKIAKVESDLAQMLGLVQQAKAAAAPPPPPPAS